MSRLSSKKEDFTTDELTGRLRYPSGCRGIFLTCLIPEQEVSRLDLLTNTLEILFIPGKLFT